MKFILLTLLCTSLFFAGFCQTFLGEWSGSFTDNLNDNYSYKEYPIKLYFVLNKDSSYKVYSYSKGFDTIVVCNLSYVLSGKDSIYLEETKIVQPNTAVSNVCLQKMSLRFSKNKQSFALNGFWECSSGKEYGYGNINFIKKQKVVK
ncbi:MAG: hypothetical protein V4556_11420 [Bacteroidota bacterium]